MIQNKSEPTASPEMLELAESRYLFRGDDNYRGGAVGFSLGVEADAADIQDFAEHVLHKESQRTSRYISFTRETKIARKFTSAHDNRYINKAEMVVLRELEAQGVLRIWDAERIYDTLKQGTKKRARQAADVRAAMRKNQEILIEGRIPEGILRPVN